MSIEDVTVEYSPGGVVNTDKTELAIPFGS
jgi:hypothetical protein